MINSGDIHYDAFRLALAYVRARRTGDSHQIKMIKAAIGSPELLSDGLADVCVRLLALLTPKGIDIDALLAELAELAAESNGWHERDDGDSDQDLSV